VVTTTNGNPIYTNTAELPTELVTVSTQIGTAVTLDSTPAAGEGTIRIWYLYTIVGSSGPSNMEIAPRFVVESRSQYIDLRFLNSALNLSDLASASTARSNLGFTNATSGAVLLGTGSTDFSSDPTELFWDTTLNTLGVGTNTPTAKIHAFSAAASITSSVETQFTTANPIVQLKASRTAGADLANADIVGQIDFNGAFNSTSGTLASIDAIYTGNGTTQNCDLVFYTAQAGAATEVLRLNASGQIDTTFGAGAIQSSAGGILSSGTLPVSLGGTNSTSYSANHVIIADGAGTTLTSEAQLAISRGGTALSAVGTASQLFGTNAAANAFEHKAATLTAAGTLTIPSGQVIIVPDGLVSAPSIQFSSDADTGLYYGGTQDVAIAANGSQAALFASALVTITPAMLLKAALRIEDPGAGTNYVAIVSPTLSGDYTLTLPTIQATVANQALVNDGAGVLSWSATPVLAQKSGSLAINSGVKVQAVTFGTTFGSTNYSIKISITNTTDADPTYHTPIVISKAATGFTAEWNELTDTANYVLEWSIVGHYDP